MAHVIVLQATCTTENNPTKPQTMNVMPSRDLQTSAAMSRNLDAFEARLHHNSTGIGADPATFTQKYIASKAHYELWSQILLKGSQLSFGRSNSDIEIRLTAGKCAMR